MNDATKAIHAYYPFEAAIAWCELSEDDARTVRLDMQVAPGPLPPDYPQWPCLYERAALILDAVASGELPYGLHGKPGYDRLPLESELPWITVRHFALKDWISWRLPHEKPAFLFSATERAAQADLDRAAELAAENDALRAAFDLMKPDNAELDPRSETAYLNIIGALLALLLGKSASGKPNSVFSNQTAVIAAILHHFEGCYGLGERTLQDKLPKARKILEKTRSKPQ
jgi:hypothetical protein